MAGWTSIPAELLVEISGRLLSDADRMHIRQVCSHWRASTSPLAAGRPWIVAGRKPRNLVGPVGEHSFWLPLGGQRIYLDTPASLPHCCGMPLGWLALTDNLQSPTRFILWEALSQTEISLPCLSAVVQVFLSGDPLTSPDWMAIASQKLHSSTCMGQTLFFWRPGDPAWAMQLEPPDGRIYSAAFHQGKFYFTDMGWNLHVYDLDRSPPKLVRITCLYWALVRRHGPLGWPGSGTPTWYVVAFNGELLLVVMYMYQLSPDMRAVEVYRPDWTAERLELRDKVTDLGDYSLFFGRGDAFALCAKEFTTIRRNCVYFVEHNAYNHQNWAIALDLASNVSERIPYPGEQTEGAGKSNHWSAYSWFCLRRPFLKGEAQ